MDDSHIDSWCDLENLAAILGHGWPSHIHLRLSYVELFHRHARGLFLRLEYIAMVQSSCRPRTCSILSNSSASFSSKSLQQIDSDHNELGVQLPINTHARCLNESVTYEYTIISRSD